METNVDVLKSSAAELQEQLQSQESEKTELRKQLAGLSKELESAKTTTKLQEQLVSEKSELEEQVDRLQEENESKTLYIQEVS